MVVAAAEAAADGEKDTRLDADLDRPWFISRGRMVCIDARSVAATVEMDLIDGDEDATVNAGEVGMDVCC